MATILGTLAELKVGAVRITYEAQLLEELAYEGIAPHGFRALRPGPLACQLGLRNTLDLARLADRLGYERFWLAEHHNLPSVASSVPEVMIGEVASVTE